MSALDSLNLLNSLKALILPNAVRALDSLNRLKSLKAPISLNALNLPHALNTLKTLSNLDTLNAQACQYLEIRVLRVHGSQLAALKALKAPTSRYLETSAM